MTPREWWRRTPVARIAFHGSSLAVGVAGAVQAVASPGDNPYQVSLSIASIGFGINGILGDVSSIRESVKDIPEERHRDQIEQHGLDAGGDATERRRIDNEVRGACLPFVSDPAAQANFERGLADRLADDPTIDTELLHDPAYRSGYQTGHDIHEAFGTDASRAALSRLETDPLTHPAAASDETESPTSPEPGDATELENLTDSAPPVTDNELELQERAPGDDGVPIEPNAATASADAGQREPGASSEPEANVADREQPELDGANTDTVATDQLDSNPSPETDAAEPDSGSARADNSIPPPETDDIDTPNADLDADAGSYDEMPRPETDSVEPIDTSHDFGPIPAPEADTVDANAPDDAEPMPRPESNVGEIPETYASELGEMPAPETGEPSLDSTGPDDWGSMPSPEPNFDDSPSPTEPDLSVTSPAFAPEPEPDEPGL